MHTLHNIEKPPVETKSVSRWALLIPEYWPPSLNQVAMAHWSKVRKHKAHAQQLLFNYALAAGGIPAFQGPVKVTIIRLIGYRQRLLDEDNLMGSVKPLVDAMRAERAGRNQQGQNRHGGLGIFADDNPGDLDLTVTQRNGQTTDTKDYLRSLGIEADERPRRNTGDGGGALIIVEGQRIQ